MLTRQADVTSATCSSARRAICLVAVRRVVLLGAFLLGGFAIAASWSAAACAAENVADAPPTAVHNRLVDLVTAAADTAKTTAATTTGVADSVQGPMTIPVAMLSPTLDTVDETTGLSLVTRVVADKTSTVLGDGLLEVLRDTAREVVTVIDDTVIDRGVVHEMLGPDAASPPGSAVGFTQPLAAATPTTVARNPHGVEAARPAMSAGLAPVVAGGTSVSRGNGFPRDFPTGFPVVSFAAAGAGAGTSSAGSSGGPTSGVVLPGRVSRDDAFITEIAPEAVYPLRHSADDPEISPA